MDEKDMQDIVLQDIISEAVCEYLETMGELSPDICTFDEAGLLTGNTGLVIDIDGNKFQVTIVKV